MGAAESRAPPRAPLPHGSAPGTSLAREGLRRAIVLVGQPKAPCLPDRRDEFWESHQHTLQITGVVGRNGNAPRLRKTGHYGHVDTKGSLSLSTATC